MAEVVYPKPPIAPWFFVKNGGKSPIESLPSLPFKFSPFSRNHDYGRKSTQLQPDLFGQHETSTVSRVIYCRTFIVPSPERDVLF